MGPPVTKRSGGFKTVALYREIWVQRAFCFYFFCISFAFEWIFLLSGWASRSVGQSVGIFSQLYMGPEKLRNPSRLAYSNTGSAEHSKGGPMSPYPTVPKM